MIFLTLFFFIPAFHYTRAEIEENSIISKLEVKLENKICEYADSVTKWLGDFNDKNLGVSELGRLVHYEEIKPKLIETARKERSVKKMSMSMMPLIFHIGATSTWMMLTALMAAKSVALGLALLVFKIAVSSAKVASFFTTLKNKHHHQEYSWNPHHEHGHERSMTVFDFHPHHHETHIQHEPQSVDWHSYAKHSVPEWTPTNEDYKTLPGPIDLKEKKTSYYADETD